MLAQALPFEKFKGFGLDLSQGQLRGNTAEFNYIENELSKAIALNGEAPMADLYRGATHHSGRQE